jgi:hypothetical protein
MSASAVSRRAWRRDWRCQSRVELVCSPRLLETDVKTVEQMQLVNALCRFVELARIFSG